MDNPAGLGDVPRLVPVGRSTAEPAPAWWHRPGSRPAVRGQLHRRHGGQVVDKWQTAWNISAMNEDE